MEDEANDVQGYVHHLQHGMGSLFNNKDGNPISPNHINYTHSARNCPREFFERETREGNVSPYGYNVVGNTDIIQPSDDGSMEVITNKKRNHQQISNSTPNKTNIAPSITPNKRSQEKKKRNCSFLDRVFIDDLWFSRFQTCSSGGLTLAQLQEDYLTFRNAHIQNEEIREIFKTYIKDYLFDNKVEKEKDISDPTNDKKIIFNIVYKQGLHNVTMFPEITLDESTDTTTDISFMEDVEDKEVDNTNIESNQSNKVATLTVEPPKMYIFEEKSRKDFHDLIAKKFHQSKSTISAIDPIKNKNNYEKRMDFILFILKGEFNDLDNFLCHLFHYEKSRTVVEKFLQKASKYVPTQELLQKKFEEGVRYYFGLHKNHLRSISLNIRNLPHMTEDNYEAIVKILSKSKGERIKITGSIKMARMYSLTSVKEQMKKTKVEPFLGKNTIPVKNIKSLDFSKQLEAMVDKHKLNPRMLVPHIENVYSLSVKNELKYSTSSFWETHSLFIWQIYKIGGIKEGIKGTFTMRTLGSYDGSVIKYAGRQIIAGMCCLLFNSDIFHEFVRHLFEVPNPDFFGFFPERKVGVRVMSKIVGTELARMEAIPFFLTENIEIRYEDYGLSVDGAMSQKLEHNHSGTAKHKCPFCNACFADENIEKLLSQKHINELKEKNFKTIEENEINEERRKQIISMKAHGTKTLSDDRQIDDLVEFLEEERENKTEKLKGLSFTTFGASIIPGYENVPDLIKDLVTISGGRFFSKSKGEQAEFVICTYQSSRKIISKLGHKFANKKLISIKFLASLIFGYCNKDDYESYQFKSHTPPEEDLCPCSKDSTHIGVNEYPTILNAYWKEINRLFPGDEQTATNYFKKFIKNSKIHWDSLHYVKGGWMVIMKALTESEFLDNEMFKSKSGGKSKKSPNQMSGKKARNILVQYETTILPNLTEKGKNKKEFIKDLLSDLCCLQFFSYCGINVLLEKTWRLQVHLYSFLFRQSMKKVFDTNVKKAIALHTHGLTAHLPPYLEDVVQNDKRAPVQNSTEFSESQFAKLNKINTNKHEKTLAKNWIEYGRRDLFLNTEFKRKRLGKQAEKVNEWSKNFIWKSVVLPIEDESNALLVSLEKFGYKQEIHWEVDLQTNCFRFVAPTTN